MVVAKGHKWTDEQNRRRSESNKKRFPPNYAYETGGRLYQGNRLQHRVVMENILGRSLDPSEIVHHIDHNALNNDPSNLILMTKGEHNRHHFSNKVWMQCGYCNNSIEIRPSRLKTTKSGLLFCNHSCHATYCHQEGILTGRRESL